MLIAKSGDWRAPVWPRHGCPPEGQGHPRTGIRPPDGILGNQDACRHAASLTARRVEHRGPGECRYAGDFEAARKIDPRNPIPLKTFVDYGLWFQQKLLPELDQRQVAKVESIGDGFATTLDDGSHVRSNRVVVAAGIAPFQRIPPEFQTLSGDHLTHCYSGFDVHGFSGRKVVVIGAGQSALESAALLHEAGADVEIIAAIGALRWIGMHPRLHNLGPISLLERASSKE